MSEFISKPPLDAPYRRASLPAAARVEDLLARMTLAEKLGQLTQDILRGDSDDPWTGTIQAGQLGSFITKNNGPVRLNRLQKIAVEESRLGIPLTCGYDVVHGYRVTFPIPLGLSCGWEPRLLERAQSVAAREARADGVDWVFAPMCDLQRDPRWGRAAETCGEDPYLNSLCTVAQVNGFQGASPAAPDRVAACLKHFVAYGSVVGGRDYNHTEVPAAILHQSHLPPFHAGVKAGALSVMSAFNTIDGIPAAGHRQLLTGVLRNEWGFDGFVVSDWGAIGEMVNWGFAKDNAEAARLGIQAGNDMDMICKHYLNFLAAEVDAGRVSSATIDQAVRNVLGVKFRSGLFDRPYTPEDLDSAAPLPAADLALARECVTRSAVLLKNNSGALPLSPSVTRIALIGPFGADRGEMLGTWSARGRPADVVTLAEGIAAKLPPSARLTVIAGCDVNTQPRTKTLTDGTIVPDDEAAQTGALPQFDEAVQAACDADVVILALGEPRGWTGECGSRARLGLTGRQQELFDAVASVGKPVVTIVFSGRPLVLPAVIEKSTAVLFAWQPGIQAGHGLADLLFGDTAPSGRLTVSVPRDVGQIPVYYNRYKTGRPIPVATDYRDLTREPQFWFGHGLTYTTFAYGPLEITSVRDGHPASARITLTNTGARPGHEVVQLYIRQLACSHAARPEQELRGFKRVGLAPGESAEVAFPLTGEVLGYWRRDGQWQTDPGDYHIWIAPHAQTGTPVTFVFTV